MTTTKLNDLQLVLLSTAAKRASGNLLPAPRKVAADAERLEKAVTALVRRKLAARSGNQVTITDVGREALGIESSADARSAADNVGSQPAIAKGGGRAKEGAGSRTHAAASQPATARTGSKSALVIDLLGRGGGASIDDLISATGWLPHTVRAALTGLRKKGHAVDRGKEDGTSRYRLTA